MKKLLIAALAIPWLLPAQGLVRSVPDCQVEFNLNSASSSDPLINRLKGCVNWTIAYSSSGFSALTLTFQHAPPNSTDGNTPGTWTTFGGSTVTGSNPMTATTQTSSTFTGYYPYLRVTLSGLTGSGAVVGVINGWRRDSAASGGGSGDALTTNPLSQFASTTSAQFAGVISNETGTGAVVLATSPTLVTPALGTPSAVVLTNATGLVASTGLTATGTKNSTTILYGDDTWKTAPSGGSAAWVKEWQIIHYDAAAGTPRAVDVGETSTVTTDSGAGTCPQCSVSMLFPNTAGTPAQGILLNSFLTSNYTTNGAVTLKFAVFVSGASGVVSFDISKRCIVPGATFQPSWTTGDTISSPSISDGNFGVVTGSIAINCAAGNFLEFFAVRNLSDSYSGTAYMLSANANQ